MSNFKNKLMNKSFFLRFALIIIWGFLFYYTFSVLMDEFSLMTTKMEIKLNSYSIQTIPDNKSDEVVLFSFFNEFSNTPITTTKTVDIVKFNEISKNGLTILYSKYTSKCYIKEYEYPSFLSFLVTVFAEISFLLAIYSTIKGLFKSNSSNTNIGKY